MPKVRRNPERTRSRILDAAIEEFATKTLDGARVDAIAARAGVNKRMLYHYFGNKEALFVAAMDSVFSRARPQAILSHPPAEDPVAALRELIENMFAYLEREPRITIMVNSSNLHGGRHLHGSKAFRSIMEERVARMTTILENGRRTGVFRDGANPTCLTLTVTAMIVYFFANNATLSVILDEDLRSTAARFGVARPCDRLPAQDRQMSCKRNGCAG